MSSEEEFSKWLRRKEKTFEENLKFAIKAWQSLEFMLHNKYEVILQWLCEQDELKLEDINEHSLKELLTLRAQPGLISQEAKKDFVEWFLCLMEKCAADGATRKWSELLQQLLQFELLQDLFRMDYELNARVYSTLFQIYGKYLDCQKDFLGTSETEFFATVLKSLKDNVKRCGDIEQYEAAFTKFTMPSLIEVYLVLKSFKLNFFDELLELEKMLTTEMSDEDLIRRLTNMPLHVRLLALECSVVNRRGLEEYFKQLLQHAFSEFLIGNNKTISEDTTCLYLTVAAYLLEMLHRHDVSLNMKMLDEEQTALEYLGKQIFDTVNRFKFTNLKQVLMVLCAALRLNPLILEQNVFEITACVILSPKSAAANDDEQQLFKEYLVLLMDMFRRLSRAEKFVVNLLKSVSENLENFDITPLKKRKAKDSAADVDLKRAKLENTSLAKIPISQQSSASFKYLQILFEDFFKPTHLLQQNFTNASGLTSSQSFSKLQQFWPSNPVGFAFSKIITSLMSKPSLVIWKSLLHALKGLLQKFETATGAQLNEKLLLELDFHVALLTQYFAGCKLAEQSDKSLDDLHAQREFTRQVLKEFGKVILLKLAGEKQQMRIVCAFLEASYYASAFELLLSYYRADGCTHNTIEPSVVLERLHDFLTTKEWSKIEQIVSSSSGCKSASDCKHLLQRLQLQKSQANLLLLSASENLERKSSISDALSFDNTENMNFILDNSNAQWIISKLKPSEKQTLASYILSKSESKNFLAIARSDLELLEYISLNIYEKLAVALNSKRSLLKTLTNRCEEIRQTLEQSACEILIKQLFDTIIEQTKEDSMHKLKKVNTDEVKLFLDLITQLPMGQLRRQRKTIIFALQLCLYSDLKVAGESELSVQALEIMKDLLHFGQKILIFKYIPTRAILKLLPPESCWELYEFVLSTIKNEEKGTEEFLKDLVIILQESQKTSHGALSDEELRLLLSIIEILSGLSGPGAKRMHVHLEQLLELYSSFVSNHFSSVADGHKESSKKTKKFVQKTLAGYSAYASGILSKVVKANEAKNKAKKEGEEHKQEENDKVVVPEITEDFRRISKIYIGHSMDYRNPHAIRLMQAALNYRELLHLDQDEIEFVLTHYWTQINEDLKKLSLDQADKLSDNKTIGLAVKMIIGNKTNEDLLLTLKTIDENVQNENFVNILSLLSLIAKCPFSTIKGAIFNEQYKQITLKILLKLGRDEQQQFQDYNMVIQLLNSHEAILNNKLVPISGDTLDSILSFLMDINIKKFNINDDNIKLFNNLHLAMIDVCSAMIKQRHLLLMDRVPQYMHIFKDLLQAIVWYKSDRQKDTALPSSELNDISELALKMEGLMHLIAHQSVAVKRVAPFVLTFVINLMVANKRPTTLYNNIKTHIENICYDLVGICDHRIGRFILRCSNEAGRQLYELLVKDYQKYHKFKGKV